MQEHNLSSPALIVTNEFHVLRAQMIAHSMGMHASTLPARTAAFYFGPYFIRELYGVLSQIFF